MTSVIEMARKPSSDGIRCILTANGVRSPRHNAGPQTSKVSRDYRGHSSLPPNRNGEEPQCGAGAPARESRKAPSEFYKKGCQEKSSASTGGREDFVSRSSPLLCKRVPSMRSRGFALACLPFL